MSKIEYRVRTIENQIREIEICMEGASTNFEELNKLHQMKEELEKELDLLLEKWIII
jgi:TolA-binding protein